MEADHGGYKEGKEAEQGGMKRNRSQSSAEVRLKAPCSPVNASSRSALCAEAGLGLWG